MTCPACGGEKRSPVGANLWRCVSLRIETVGGPGLTNPALGPPVIERQVECGTEYQEGAPTSTLECACGTFAVGRCALCRTPVCGTCSALVDGRRLCRSCRAELRAAEAKRESAASRQRAAAAQAGRDQWRARMLEELADASGTERIVRIVGGLTSEEAYDHRGWYHHTTDWPAIEELFGAKPKWTVPELTSFFLSRVSGDPERLLFSRRTVFGGYKDVFRPGWAFERAARQTYTFKDATPAPWSMAFTRDGKVWVKAGWGPWLEHATHQPPHTFSAYGVRQIGQRCGLRLVEPPPRQRTG